MQVYEKYVNLARDASSSGDRIAAESYQQYAEHYFRILNDTTDPQRPAPERPATETSAPERSAPERSVPERGRVERVGAEPGKVPHQPYPIDAEQPFVDGAPVAPEGNGQVPEAAKEADGSAEPAPTDGESPPVVAEEPEAKPRAKSRPRTRTRAKNGSATKAGNGAGGRVKAAPCEPSEASEPGS